MSFTTKAWWWIWTITFRLAKSWFKILIQCSNSTLNPEQVERNYLFNCGRQTNRWNKEDNGETERATNKRDTWKDNLLGVLMGPWNFWQHLKRYTENFMPPLTKFKAAWLKGLETPPSNFNTSGYLTKNIYLIKIRKVCSLNKS